MKQIKTTVFFSEDEIQQVINFGQSVQVSPHSFGQKDSRKRNEAQMRMDMTVGKLGEVAFQKFLWENFKIDTPIDWEIYDRNIGDSQDSLVFGHRFEIKSIKKGDWFLIEQDTMARRKMEGLVPHYYVLVKVSYDEINHRPNKQATIIGYCPLEHLAQPSNLLKKGSILPTKNISLKATNFGIHSSALHTNWGVLLFQLQDIYSQIIHNLILTPNEGSNRIFS